MTDVDSSQAPIAAASAVLPGPDKRALAQKTLTELLALLEVPSTFELIDAADGGFSVALQLQGDLPGLQPGRRSPVLEALQFLVNKIVNRPGTERRWVSLGVGAHPEPRGQGPKGGVPKQGGGPAPRSPAPTGASNGSLAPPASPQQPDRGIDSKAARPDRKAPRPAGPAAEVDERQLAVSEDAPLRAQAVRLAEKSAKFGRLFALVGMRPEERAQVVQAAQAVAGLSLQLEGEGRSRRVIFTPDKPTPMPKRAALPDDDEDLE